MSCFAIVKLLISKFFMTSIAELWLEWDVVKDVPLIRRYSVVTYELFGVTNCDNVMFFYL